MPGPDLGRIIKEIVSLERSLTPEGVIGEMDGNVPMKVNYFSKTG
jgi:hypothetical protein